MQVTISGDIGSGKSTVGEYLAKRLGAELVDCGQLYRAYASKRDMNVLQLNQSGDDSIDRQIDNDLIRMGKEDKPRVYVSRTAWHFIPNAVHVYMAVNPLLAAQRILKRKTVAENHDTIETIIDYNCERIAQEDARYERMYGITRRQQMESNNVFMCIGENGIKSVCGATYNMLSKGNVVCFDPRIAVPTQVMFDVDPKLVEKFAGNFSKVDCTDIKVQMVNGIPYIVDGHHRIAAACKSGVSFMYTSNFEVEDEPLCRLGNSDYYDWEEFVGGDMSAITGVRKTPEKTYIYAVNS